MKEWLFWWLVGDPTMAIAMTAVVLLLLLFKPTRGYVIASMFLYIVLF